MRNDYNTYGTIYWVFTQLCNDECDHCYNDSGPKGKRMTDEECLQIIHHLPEKLSKIILSGGEPLADRKQLYLIIDTLIAKYGQDLKITIQTNGDLMTGKILDILLEKGVKGFSIASLDRFHKHAGAKLNILKELFDSRGLVDIMPYITVGVKDEEKRAKLDPNWRTYSYFGANEEMWLGGNWARGRAFTKDLWMQNHLHNFCNIQSGAKNFLGGHQDVIEELSIQLWAINPCCPGTKKALGDARKEKIADVLLKVKESEIFKALNDGEPYKMGESIGVSEAYAVERGKKLQNICLWCDEFFDKHYHMDELRAKTAEEAVTDSFIKLPVISANP
ncbi:radical SAM protein [Pedobacter glucosidilyticus]|uniref:radical SAM protein n=1 Tax=Pedobacter glucosidilyticus TaxID=1122941 RepID=UPI0006847568|nr:radical SAM protein [Pedobacter glucosidilyticus]